MYLDLDDHMEETLRGSKKPHKMMSADKGRSNCFGFDVCIKN